nr:hypothetical protein [uncultured Tolumonas sp.]
MIIFISGVCGSGKTALARGLVDMMKNNHPEIFSNYEILGTKIDSLIPFSDKKNCLFVIDEAQSFDLSPLINNEIFVGSNKFLIVCQHEKLLPKNFMRLVSERITLTRKIIYER